MILFIDNYDSFVHNLARYFRRLGQGTLVVRNDAIDVTTIRRLRPSAIVLSPGPCTPAQAGCSLAVVTQLHRDFPMLGVCLGHQAIGEAFGGRIVRAPEPMHGRTSLVTHRGEGLFAGLPQPMTVCRYHSLVVDESTLDPALQVTARTEDGLVMALEHRQWPICSVQFHPEAILTQGGYALLANFLRLAGLAADVCNLPAEELPTPGEDAWQPPTRPVTF